VNTKTKIISLAAGILWVSVASSTELVHQFNSPAFSGVGYSSHVLTIEQLEATRRQKIKDDLATAAAKEAAAAVKK
jgi:hypothetical protein